MYIVLSLILACIGYITKFIIMHIFKIHDENSMTYNVLNDHSYSTMNDGKSSNNSTSTFEDNISYFDEHYFIFISHYF